VFGWTTQKFPFTVKSVHDLTIAEHVVTIIGNAVTTSQTRPQIIQTDGIRRKITLLGNSSGDQARRNPIE